MNALLALWLPILLSAVVVFVLSSLVHMVFKWHNSDYQGLSNEDVVRDAVRAGNPTPGLYVLPYCSDMKEMDGDVMKKKYADGPVGFITIAPSGPCNMGRTLGLWFVMCLVVSAIAAFLAGHLLPLDSGHARAAGKLVGAVSFLAYGFAGISESIWMARRWSSTAKFLFDSVLYGAASGLIFYFFWH